MRRRAAAVAVLGILALVGGAGPAHARTDCSRTVVFTLPGVTWQHLDRYRPPTLLDAIEDGSAGSMSIRTISARTSYASGFATIGGGSRIDAGRFAGALRIPTGTRDDPAETPVAGLDRLRADAEAAGYEAVPGALGEALGAIPTKAIGNADTGLPAPVPAGYGRWTLLAAMDAEGFVDEAHVSPELLEPDAEAPYGVRTNQTEIARVVDGALEEPCSLAVIDQGDLARVDEWEVATGIPDDDARRAALEATDDLLARVQSNLDPERDLLLIASPTSPWLEEEAHLGVAIAVGDGFEPNTTLQSASTRRSGMVTLPDVGPTILKHLGLPLPPSMTGRPFFTVAGPSDTVEAQIEVDRESIFVENMKTPVTAGYVIVQVLIYTLAIALIRRRARAADGPADDVIGRWLQLAVLAVVAFPIATYLGGVFDQHAIGSPQVYGLLLLIDLALVVPVYFLIHDEIDRLLAICALTVVILFADLLMGARLQLNTVFGYSPIVAGRFAGLGNIAFAVLGVASLLTGALVAHRWQGRRWALWGAGSIFLLAVIFDGAPQLGSDVGGVLALVPSFALTMLLLLGGRVNWKYVVLGVLAGVLAVGAFLAIDLGRPPDQRTHLARLYEDVRERGPRVLVDTIERKASANIRLFKKSLWTYFVPPALVAIGVLMRRPRGRWVRIVQTYPNVRAGLIGGLALAALGFAVNDSGIVIPAVILSFLVPLAVIVHLLLDRNPRPPEPLERAA